MQAQQSKQWKTRVGTSLYVKCGAVFLLFLLSVLIVACSSGATTTNGDLGNPPVTVTIQLGNDNNSPTPPLPDYSCGAWATNTSPSLSNTSTVGVYAKFVHNVAGNPVGEDQATATALVQWPDGSTTTQTVQTTGDGLAVFSVSIIGRAYAINKFTFISVTFTKSGTPGCTVPQDRVAFFTIVVVSPTATVIAVPSATATPSVTVTTSPTVTPTCTPIPKPPKKKPTPTPTPPFC